MLSIPGLSMKYLVMQGDVNGDRVDSSENEANPQRLHAGLRFDHAVITYPYVYIALIKFKK